MRVAVFGAGYVGCVTAACLAEDGNQVWLVENDAKRRRTLLEGRSPIAEPRLDALLCRSLGEGRIRVVQDAALAVHETEIALVCVGTPSAADGGVDARDLQTVLESLGRFVSKKSRYVIALRSTVPGPVLEREILPSLRRTYGDRFGREISFAVHPEFLRQGTAISDFRDPPFLLIGTAHSDAAECLAELFGTSGAPTLKVSVGSASLVKYACNAFHALKITFANEIDAVAPLFGADGSEVMEVLCQDRRLNISSAYLRPGFAFGGSCLTKDLKALNQAANKGAVEIPMLASVSVSNEKLIELATSEVMRFSPASVGMIGLSFKNGTDDTRSSPLLRLALELERCQMEMSIYDPDVSGEAVPEEARGWMRDSLEQILGEDLIVVGKMALDPTELVEQLPRDRPVLDLTKHHLLKSHPTTTHLKAAGSPESWQGQAQSEGSR